MTVELPLVTGWLLPWDPLRLRKLMAVVLGSILEVEKEEVTFLALDTHTHSRGSEVNLKWSFVVRTIDSKERRVRARIPRANRMDTAQ